MIERYNSNGIFSEAVIHNGILYLSGKVGSGDTVTEQATDVLNKIEAALEKYGSDKDHILTAVVYLADIGAFAEFNAVWKPGFAESMPPARTCVEAQMAAPQYLVEVTITAAVK